MTIDIHKERMEEFNEKFPVAYTWFSCPDDENEEAIIPSDIRSFFTHTLRLILEDDIKRLETEIAFMTEEGVKPDSYRGGFIEAKREEITHKKSQLKALEGR